MVSCFAGHGDLSAGDSIGPTITQATLVPGLLPFVVGPFRVRGVGIASLCLTTTVTLAAGALLLRDGYLSRVDGLIFVGAWIGGSALLWRPSGDDGSRTGDGLSPHRLRHGIVALALVGLGSGLAVMAYLGAYYVLLV